MRSLPPCAQAIRKTVPASVKLRMTPVAQVAPAFFARAYAQASPAT
ncbi:MAG: hypothetical protein QM765_06605 [Myxococcales bacterium]